MSQLTHNLICKYSGLRVGQLTFSTVAGAVPYLMQWSELVPLHPVFSLNYQKLLDFSKSEWNRLAMRTANDELTDAEEDILRVCYLALLHRLECIKQDVAALPPISTVQATIQQLFALAYWKFHLESQRFRFPTLHISKYNDNADFKYIKDYLDTCFAVKKEYETKVNEVVEVEKLKIAEEALKKLSGEWITPTSKKLLWKWVRANLPEKYQPDAIGWLGTLFLGSNSTILEFDKEDIALAEEIIVSSCPGGNSIMFAVRARLDTIAKVWEQHHESFEIQLDELDERSGTLVNGVQMDIPHPGNAPQQKEFDSKGKYYVAVAKWEVAMAAWKKHGKQEGTGS